MSLQAYYLFEETDLTGGIISQTRIETSDIRQFLLDIHEIAEDQLSFAMQVTADNPGIPYDLYKADEKGRFEWTARVTLKVEYYRSQKP